MCDPFVKNTQVAHCKTNDSSICFITAGEAQLFYFNKCSKGGEG